MNQNMMPSSATPSPAPSSLLPSIPIPMSQKSFLSSPLSNSMPMSLPIPSKLIRASRSSPSNKERGLPSPLPSSPSTSHHHQWIIRELPELPSHYILVRTNVYVKQDLADDDDCSTASNNSQLAQQLADRICQTLKSLSITVIDDNDDSDNSTNVFVDEGSSEEEENVLFVETQYDAKFAIRLFSSSNMIVVEIKRTSGCTFEFRDTAKAILRTAANKNKQTKGLAKAKAKRRFTIPTSLPKRSKEDLARCIQDDFKIAYQMIHSSKYDTQVLGLESMEQMTRKKYSCDDEVKNVVARYVLLGSKGSCCDNMNDPDNCDCLKQLLLLLDIDQSRSSHQTSSSSSSSSSSLLLRQKILTVLANSLEAINNSISSGSSSSSSSGSNATTISTNNYDDLIIFLKTNNNSCLLSVLLSTLQETATPIRPHVAFQAVRCLRYLLLMSSISLKEEVDIITAMMKINPNALDIVSSYYVDNCHHHEGLEQESNMLITQLRQKKKTTMMSA